MSSETRNQRIDVVVPMQPGELESVAMLLIPSMRHFMAPMGACWVVTTPEGLGAAKERLQPLNVHVVADTEIVSEFGLYRPRKVKANEAVPPLMPTMQWRRLIQLSFARFAATPFFLALDPGVICVQPITFDDLVIKGRAATAVADAKGSSYIWKTSDDEWRPNERPAGVAPWVLLVDAVLGYLAEVGGSIAPHVLRAEQVLILEDAPLAEFGGYYRYLCDSGTASQYHCPVTALTGNNVETEAQNHAWNAETSLVADAPFKFSVFADEFAEDSFSRVLKVREVFRKLNSPSPL